MDRRTEATWLPIRNPRTGSLAPQHLHQWQTGGGGRGGRRRSGVHTHAHTLTVFMSSCQQTTGHAETAGGVGGLQITNSDRRHIDWYGGGGCTSSDKRRSTRLNVPERDAYRAAAEFRRRDPPKIGTPGNVFFSSSPTRRGKIRTTKA